MSERRKFNSSNLLNYLNLWVIGGAFLLACLLLFVISSTLYLTRSNFTLQNPSTAVYTVLPNLWATESQNVPPFSSSTNTPADLPSPPPGEIVLGGYVQIIGTGGDGLRLREEPGLGSRVLLLGSEAEVFRVDDGPREIDGYTWWYLVGPYDENRRGWAVSNFLQFVQNPD